MLQALQSVALTKDCCRLQVLPVIGYRLSVIGGTPFKNAQKSLRVLLQSNVAGFAIRSFSEGLF
jgi:hypothetical protein